MSTGKIFINYRRDDAKAQAGRLFDRLEAHFGEATLFFDVDHIPAGEDFVQVLHEQVAACDVMLSLVGPKWVTAERADGGRRLDDPNDFVRIEIEAALERNIKVIPVLIDDTQMPRADDLPDALEPFTRRNAVRLTHERFRSEAQGIVGLLESALDDAQVQREIRATAARERAEHEAALEEEAHRRTLLEERLAGLTPQEIAEAKELGNWRFIEDSGDAAALRDHIEQYPRGVSAQWAKAQLQAVEWATAKASNDPEALSNFIRTYPDSPLSEEATRRRRALIAAANAAEEEARRHAMESAWNAVSSADDAAAYEGFIRDWPNSQQAAVAKAKARTHREADAWRAAEAADTLEALNQFVADWPKAKNASAAERRIRSLEADAETRRRAEEAVQEWRTIENSSDPAAFGTFAKRWNGLSLAKQAQERAQELRLEADWIDLQNSTDVAALTRFARRWPNSLHAREAKRRARDLDQPRRLAVRKYTIMLITLVGCIIVFALTFRILAFAPLETSQSTAVNRASGEGYAEKPTSAPEPREAPVQVASNRQAAANDAIQSNLNKDAQRELKRLGLYGGTIDGIWGSGSARALKVFQNLSGEEFSSNTLPLEELRLTSNSYWRDITKQRTHAKFLGNCLNATESNKNIKWDFEFKVVFYRADRHRNLFVHYNGQRRFEEFLESAVQSCFPPKNLQRSPRELQIFFLQYKFSGGTGGVFSAAPAQHLFR